MKEIQFRGPAGVTDFVFTTQDLENDFADLDVDVETEEIADGIYTGAIDRSGKLGIRIGNAAWEAFGYVDLDNPDPLTGRSEVVETLSELRVLDVDSASIALDVFQRLAGSSVSMVAVPRRGAPKDAVLDVDFVDTISVSTAADSQLIYEIRHCEKEEVPLLKATKAAGLVSIKDQASVTAGDVTIVRTSATVVTVTIKARSFRLIGPGQRIAGLREITVANVTKEPYSVALNVIRSAARTYAP